MDSKLKKPIRKPHGYQPVRTKKKANGNRERYSYEEYVRKNKPAGSDMSMNNPKESKQMDKKLIRLTEGDLHRIVEESVNRILKEYTNGFTEKLYNNLATKYADSSALSSRKDQARDYLAKRWKRENGLSNKQVDAVQSGDADEMTKAKVPGTFLKRLDKDRNVDAARSMAARLINSRKPKMVNKPKIAPQEQMPPKKEGFLDKLKSRF